MTEEVDLMNGASRPESQTNEQWFGRRSERPRNGAIIYMPPPNVCVEVNALHFHITGVSLWAIMKSIN